MKKSGDKEVKLNKKVEDEEQELKNKELKVNEKR